MEPTELVRLVKNSKPDLFKKIGDREAALVIQEILTEIGRHLETINEGVIRVPKLGKFIVRQVEQGQKGSKTESKKIVFIRAKVE